MSLSIQRPYFLCLWYNYRVHCAQERSDEPLSEASDNNDVMSHKRPDKMSHPCDSSTTDNNLRLPGLRRARPGPQTHGTRQTEARPGPSRMLTLIDTGRNASGRSDGSDVEAVTNASRGATRHCGAHGVSDSCLQ
ncbi:hypothetical protein COCON_G00117470 [Conger conger]|uniref:Uncharacterized protein n=1 Tax=Conger conger TaxID=82655 RepID=A0A9Q1HXS6_CONCO|nr:hypothetical protein COCON_G00117470 [Conger conger]